MKKIIAVLLILLIASPCYAVRTEILVPIVDLVPPHFPVVRHVPIYYDIENTGADRLGVFVLRLPPDNANPVERTMIIDYATYLGLDPLYQFQPIDLNRMWIVPTAVHNNYLNALIRLLHAFRELAPLAENERPAFIDIMPRLVEVVQGQLHLH